MKKIVVCVFSFWSFIMSLAQNNWIELWGSSNFWKSYDKCPKGSLVLKKDTVNGMWSGNYVLYKGGKRVDRLSHCFFRSTEQEINLQFKGGKFYLKGIEVHITKDLSEQIKSTIGRHFSHCSHVSHNSHYSSKF